MKFNLIMKGESDYQHWKVGGGEEEEKEDVAKAAAGRSATLPRRSTISP